MSDYGMNAQPPDISGRVTKGRDALLGSLDAELLHPRLEGRWFKTEQLCGAPFPTDLPAGQFEDPQNVVLLHVIEGEALASVRTDD